MLATGTRDFAPPVVKEHRDTYLYDDCPECGAEKRKTSAVCAACRARQRAEAVYLERAKESIRCLVRRAMKGDEVRIFIEASPECDLPEVMAEVVAEVMG